MKAYQILTSRGVFMHSAALFEACDTRGLLAGEAAQMIGPTPPVPSQERVPLAPVNTPEAQQAHSQAGSLHWIQVPNPTAVCLSFSLITSHTVPTNANNVASYKTGTLAALCCHVHQLLLSAAGRPAVLRCSHCCPSFIKMYCGHELPLPQHHF